MLVFGADDAVIPWVWRRIGLGENFPDKAVSIGVVRGDALIAGAVFHEFRGHDIQMSLAGDHARWATRGTIRAFLSYPFLQAKCVRVTATVARGNKRSRKLIEGVGFRQEGCHRLGYDGVQDMISYGLTKDDWMKGRFAPVSA